jgi:hypothetical protein
MKIRSVGAELFHPYRRTDRHTHRGITKLTAAFRNFAETLKTILSEAATSNEHFRHILSQKWNVYS